MNRNKEELIDQIIEVFDHEDEIILSKAYEDGGTEGLSPRLSRAALSQISEGDATISRYAIWANTLRDNILHAIQLLNNQDMVEAKRFLVRAVNSLAAFTEIQALTDPMKVGHPRVGAEKKHESR
jgi:hypothetical protein